MNLRASLAGSPVLEKYDLLEEIGHGGMATVYRSMDKRLGREVAVKVIHKHLRENSEVAARFVAEARAAAKLRHPNIVEVYDVSADDDRYRYLVVELIRGTTLRKILQDHRDMPAEVGAAIVLELCDALTHAHEGGIIHRDVKPENVLIELPCGCKGSPHGEGDSDPPPRRGRDDRDSGRPSSEPKSSDPKGSDAERSGRRSLRGRDHVVIKITDFGIAKILDAQGVTATGQVLGSPAHMAPEQIEGGEVDPRTDVFALGVLMYEALVGHLPFEGKNPAQVLRKVLDGKYPPPEGERASIGARWAKIVMEALAREPEGRTATPAILGEQIREELSALGITDPPTEILAYFRDPEGYPAALAERIVPILLSRGEAAKRLGDSQAAAANFNRALALRPHDLAILKRITSLSASRNRRALLRRAATIAGSSVALGLVSIVTVRFLRDKPVEITAPPAPTVIAADDPPPEDTYDPELDGPIDPSNPSAAPESSGKPRVRPYILPTSVTIASSSAPVAPPKSTRRVRFTVIPAGGAFSLDGTEKNWLNTVFELPLGAHAVRVRVPSADCCDELNGSITVTRPPPDNPEMVEHFTLRAPLRPATVTLGGAPPNAQLLCTKVAVSIITGQSAKVTLPEMQWTGTCEFRPPQADAAAKKLSVTLRAGKLNTVPWPG